MISKVATPIAGMLGSDCYDPVTRDLKPNSPCGQTRTRLDGAQTLRDYGSAIFDRFWSSNKKGDKMTDELQTQDEEVDYMITVAVKAVDSKQALERLGQGKILAINPRPQPRPMQAGTGTGAVGQTVATGQPISQGRASTQGNQ